MSEVIHVIVKHGRVIGVLEIGETPGDYRYMEIESEYKVDYIDEYGGEKA